MEVSRQRVAQGVGDAGGEDGEVIVAIREGLSGQAREGDRGAVGDRVKSDGEAGDRGMRGDVAQDVIRGG